MSANKVITIEGDGRVLIPNIAGILGMCVKQYPGM